MGGGLTPSKFKYETLYIRRDFIKFSVCEVYLQKFKAPYWKLSGYSSGSKPHILSHDGLVTFDF